MNCNEWGVRSMELKDTVALNLRVMMAERRLRATRVANDTKIARSTLSKITTGKNTSISFAVLEKLANYLGVPATAFFEQKQEPTSAGTEVSQ